jgi:hypothetical protein
MRRWVGWVAALAVAGGLVAAGGASASAATPGTTAGPAVCTSTSIVQINSLTFVPSAVAPGQSSVATLKASNCTAQTVQTTTYWYGRFVGPTPGIPTGCPVVDPIARPLTFTPHGSASLSTRYTTFPSCTATSFQLNVRIIGPGGALLASRDATLTIIRP